MIHYDILTEETPGNLILAVQARINKGWTPLGGVSVARIERAARCGTRTEYVQAITIAGPKISTPRRVKGA